MNPMNTESSPANNSRQSNATMQDALLKVMSHQLRTPPTAIKWIIQLFLEEKLGPLTEKQKDFLKRVEENNQTMLSIIEDFLYASRIRRGEKFSLDRTSTDMITLVQQVIDRYKPIADRHNKTISFINEISTVSKVLMVDRAKMQKAVECIVENAVSYTREEDCISIQLREEKADTLTLEVEDTGIGIPEEEKDIICTLFYRAPNAVLHKPEGTGLGLFIAKHVIEMHGGKIEINSYQGKTSFTISIQIQ